MSDISEMLDDYRSHLRDGATVELVPDMRQALADLRELKTLSTRFGGELIGCLTSIAEGVTPVLLCDVLDVPTVGKDHAVSHFKLTEEFQRCLAALRAWNSDLHIAHEVTPKMLKAGMEEYSSVWLALRDAVPGEAEQMLRRAYAVMACLERGTQLDASSNPVDTPSTP